MPAASKLGCPGGAYQQFHDLSVVRDWNFKHLFTGAQTRWPQRGTGRRGTPTWSRSWGGGAAQHRGTQVPGDSVSKAKCCCSKACLEFGTGRDLLSCVIPFEHFRVKERCCLWGPSCGVPQGLCCLLMDPH